MASALQRLVDGLGDRLRRSVAIDDRNIRLLAYNSHPGEVDAARVESIMRREVSKELVDNLHHLGVLDADDLFTVPVNPALGLTLERIGMPIRHDGGLLGFLWLLASDGPLDDDAATAVRQAAEQAAHILQRDHLLDELRQGRIREHLRDLLADDPRLHAGAAQRLIEEEIMVAGPVTALVVAVPHEDDQPLTEKDRLALAIGLDHACRRALPRGAIHLERADHGVVVVAHTGSAAGREIDDLAAAVQRHVSLAGGRAAGDCVVGIGESRRGLSEVRGSYLEALRATDVGRVIRVLGSIVRHDRLGVYGLLTELPADRLHRSLHAGLQRLMDYDGEGIVLTSTLEAFLDNAGDIKRTATRLNLHRASVHYRLRRIEEIAQVDLASGDDRLALHLGLKVAQLIELR
jgi:DNA-binding PucR family transcriptional regulator